MAYQILLIDDDTSFRSEFREYFSDVRVIEASSGKEAQNILKKPNDIDLVILDEMLNNERGTEILPYLRQAAPDLDIILLTGYSSKDVVVDALRVHAADFLEKPLDEKKYEIIRSYFTAVPREKDGSFTNGFEGKIEWVKHYLCKNYDKKVTLNDVADSVCWSTKYLSRIFKDHIGSSFSEYKLGIKIEKAKEWLQDHGRTVDQISLKLGYENPDSFIKIFKKFTGNTPTEYRKKVCQKQASGKDMSTELMIVGDKVFNSTDAIIEMSSQGRISVWTPTAEKAYGWTSKEAVGKLIYDFIPKNCQKEKKELISRLRQGEASTSFESQRLTKSGKVIDVEIAIIPLWDKSGRLVKVVSVEHGTAFSKKEPHDLQIQDGLKDIQKKRDPEKFRHLSDVGRLASMVAHELRNPIGVIGTAVWNIRRKNSNPDLEKNIKSIEKKIDESIAIINSLLNYSKIKIPDFKKVKLDDIINDCVDLSRHRFRQRRDIIRLDSDAARGVCLYADPDHLKQILKNIIVNAYQALAGVPKARIDIQIGIENDKVFIWIKDNGHGIKKENLEKVFDLFYSERSGGSGLGLAVAKQLVELHDGSIKIESKKGKGTSVCVSLPVHP